MSEQPTIIYTKTDEAPALATYSLLPIIRAFTSSSNISVILKDISLAGRILSQFPEDLREDQRVEDALSELGALTQVASTNIIKLPNISASLPQMLDTIEELKSQGYSLPDYPTDPQSEKDAEIKAKYDKTRGSAVNPVLREGNSDRRAPKAVKKYAQNNPHGMGSWSKESQSHVSSMTHGDFFDSEKSRTFGDTQEKAVLSIDFTDEKGNKTILKEDISIKNGEVVDTSFMSKKALCTFFEEQIKEAKEQGVLLSVHLKATMMKVSDPIIFGHMVKIFYKEVFEKYANLVQELGINPNNGIADFYSKIENLPSDTREEIENSIQKVYASQPPLAMVNHQRVNGKTFSATTNLHLPNNVIIDASMPAAIRWSGHQWDAHDKGFDAKFIIPDRSYAGIYEEVINFCKEHGAFDVSTMGSVSNVGLMAQKAEEYGSHDKTFEIPTKGQIAVRNQDNIAIFYHDVEEGDIWRMCQVKDEPIRDWVKLAVGRARAVGAAVFWLDPNRAHDNQLIIKVEEYLKEYDTDGADIFILPPADAMRYTLDRVKAGLDTVSVTGNVLRDYLTDLFPILELGTSAKMLSIVPLMKGGGLFETGAGGSAPKHVQQFVTENHLRWDSLGEFLALAVSFEHLAKLHDHEEADLLGRTLDEATTRLLQEGKSPLRKVHQLDNRGSHYYLALFWAEALATQHEDANLKAYFSPLALKLREAEQTIIDELNKVQGVTIDLGGYFHPSDELCTKAMRPSETFNKIIASCT